MADRYYSCQPIAGERAELTGDEAQHLSRVMRAQAGDEVLLFDGSGREVLARVVSASPKRVELSVVEARQVNRELPTAVTLGVALPKGDRQKWLVEKLVELGVTRLTPLITRRGVAQPVESAIERLERGVIEASKQCGRNKLMEVTPGVTLTAFLAAAPTGALRMFAHPGSPELASATWPPGAECYAAIGPEGGWDEAETAAAQAAGWRLTGLGPRILRVETAAITLAAWAAANAATTG
jgi:16S rRNA (uracil1498-N3)-methyltransferase